MEDPTDKALNEGTLDSFLSTSFTTTTPVLPSPYFIGFALIGPKFTHVHTQSLQSSIMDETVDADENARQYEVDELISSS